MEVESTNCGEVSPTPTTDTQTGEDVPDRLTKIDSELVDKIVDVSVQTQNSDNIESTVNSNRDDYVEINDESIANNDESGVVMDGIEVSPAAGDKDRCVQEPCEVNDDVRSLGDLDSLPAGDELALGAAGSDSGVEGCGRALSSGGGSRSCASSVVSCGSGCGSESSSLAGAPPRPRRRVNVNVAEPKRSSPVGSSTPRPVTAPRGPNLATRERARSREKPALPEKPRPLTPKPRIRPTTTDLPNLVRESPALRAKPTKTSTARCRTPNSPCEEKRWPSNGPRLATVADANAQRNAADKYGTLPRKRRDAEPEGSPKHESTPPSSRRPTVARSSSTRSAVRTRVRIYAEKTTQTVLLGTDVESALGGVVPNIETARPEVTRCHRGVQASGREAEAARLAGALAAGAQERARRLHAEAALAEERAARHAALTELERNSQRLLELAGAAGAGAGAEGCLRALEEQLGTAGELATRHRAEIDILRDKCNKLHIEACAERERARLAEARLAAAECEAAEMQDFLAAETASLTHSLRDADAEAERLRADLDKRRTECRQLVRMCEQRRQEALSVAARARGGAGAARALDSLQRKLMRLTRAVVLVYRLPRDAVEPTVFHNEAFSRSDSGDALTPEEEPRGGLVGAVVRALRAPAPPAPADDDRSRLSDDNDSADLLDSETEPCLVTDPEYAEEWWSGAEGAGAWSADELSPERDCAPDLDKEAESASASERESLRNLSAAIAQRQRSEAEDERGALLCRVAALDARLSALLAALRHAAAAAPAPAAAPPADDAAAARLATALRDKLEVTERNVADVVVKKLAELDASNHMMEQYRHSVETLKKQLAQAGEEDDLEYLEEELSSCSESERRALYEALDAALAALSGAAPRQWPRLAASRARLERLAFALAAGTVPPAPPRAAHAPPPLHTPA